MNGDPEASAEAWTLSNEFAYVIVRTVRTSNGVRLEIEAPQRGRVIRLCPLELESLTWQPPATFSTMLSNPLGDSEDDIEL
jgi:hypothetical protein